MKKILLFALMALVSTVASSQNISYTSLYDNTTFDRSIVQTLPVGATAGQGSVTSTGGAAYSIPIFAPPGTNGVVPSVALEYNSQAPNGIAGVGWNLSGLSAITRVPKSIYHDGSAGPVELSLNDRFAMNDVRLVLKGGTYGVANSTYGTENETFSTITAYDAQGGGPLYFKLVAKDGTVLEYGNTADSRFLSETGNTVMAWRLNKVQDLNGNYIEFVYINTDRDPRISEIRYTGNAAASIAPYNKIEFAYKIRQETSPGTFSDIRTVYEAGSSIVSKYLLDKITVKAEGVTTKTYQLGYGNDKVNSYLKSIQEGGADGSLLNSTLFKYGNVPVEEQTSTSTIPSGNNIEAFAGDYDGDGIQDIFSGTFTVTDGIRFFSNFKIYKRNQANESYSLLSTTTLDAGYTVRNIGRSNYERPNSSNLLQGDWNGDGLDDVIALNLSIIPPGSDWSLNNIKLYKNTSSGSAFTAQSRAIVGKINANGNYFFPGDFNGDGVSEFITILANSSTAYTPTMHSDFITNGAATDITVPVPGSIALTDWVNAKIRVLDFNGDGKSDLMLVGATTCEIYTFSGSVASRIYSGNFPLKQDNLYLGDFNGDGKIDVISASTDFTSVKKGSSNGVTFNTVPITFSSPWPGNLDSDPGFYGNEILVGDYNGDGKSDFYYSGLRQKTIPVADGNEVHNYSSRELYYSTGDTFKQKQLSFDDLVHTEHNLVTSIVPEETTYIGLTPVDLNGDGRTDLVSSGGNTLTYRYFNKDGKDNLIQKVLNGFNHTVEWEYKNLTTGGTFYSKGTGTSIYPFNLIQPTLNQVFEIRSQNGIGGNFTTQYSYEGARFHRAGRGFLGFTKTTVTDVTMGTKTVSENEFNTTFYITIPKKTSTYLSPNSLISEVGLTNVVVSPASKRFWVKTTGISENKALEGAIVSTSNIYDEINGNITSSTVVSPAGRDSTSTIYGAYPGPLLNKPTSVTVTKTRTGQAAFIVKSTSTYNAKGQQTSSTDFSGKANAVTTSYSYSSLGNIRKTTVSASGLIARSDSAVFDSLGRYPKKLINALLHESTADYDPKWGTPIRQTAIDGLSTTYAYDGFGRSNTITVNSDYVQTNTLSWGDSPTRVWKRATSYSQSGRAVTTQWFDQLGRQTRTQTKAFDDNIVEANTVYDARGNVYSQEQPHKSGETFITTINSYDNLNRPNGINNGSLGTTSIGYSYSGGNTKVETTSPSGVSSKTTDLAGLTIAAQDNGGTLIYTYFSHGGLKEVTNEGVTGAQSEYDEYGRQTKLIDANAGTTEYLYNAFGELAWQKNANGGSYSLSYDVLGRFTSRVGQSAPAGTKPTEGTTTTEYYNGANDGTSKGKIKKVTGFATGNNTQYEYNDRGLLKKLTETIDNISHVTNYTYNVFGDVLTTEYPSGLVITNAYTSNGYLNTISGAGATLYTTSSMNGQGQVTGYNKGKTATKNGKNSTISYSNGFVTAYSTPAVQDYQLVWDYQKGNLTSRKDARTSVNKTETFQYDDLNRLTRATISGATAFTATYAPNGNIATKKDIGTYLYDDKVKFNALTGFDNPSTVVPLLQQDISYTAFNQPDSLRENNYLLTYTYGAGYNRIKSELKYNDVLQKRRYYFGNGFEKDVDIISSTTRYLQYITGPAGLVAIIESNGANHTPHYTYTDHLGSILTVVNGSDSIEVEQSFDAWGRRRNPTTWALASTQSTTLPVWLIRGYTGHEHLDMFGLINMNGRIYDPITGRMLSPDNYVQEPFMTQSFNRYTYAMNNPLVYTDPDGNFWNFVIGAAIGGFSGWQIGKAKGAHGWGMVGYIAGGAAIGAFTAGASEAVLGMFAASAPSLATGAGATIGAYAASGAVGGAISGMGFAGLSGGDIWKGGIFGGLIGGATGALGGYLKYDSYLNNSDNWLALLGGPGDDAIEGGTFGAVTITRPWWQGLGFSLARGAASILALPLMLEGDVSKTRTKRPQKTYYYHYTDEQGIAGIKSSMTIMPNRKGIVYLTAQRFSPDGAFQDLFLSQATHAGRGNYVAIFELTSDQVASLVSQPSNPFELMYPGTLRLKMGLHWAGKNFFKYR